MKRLFILLFLSIFVIAFNSCDPPEYMMHHEGTWFVKNTTEENIVFVFDCAYSINKSFDIKPGQTVRIHSIDDTPIGMEEPISFEKLWKYVTDEENAAHVYDENGNLLTEWVWEDTEEKEKFFDEAYWQFHEERVKIKKDLYKFEREWTFTLTPEDIAK